MFASSFQHSVKDRQKERAWLQCPSAPPQLLSPDPLHFHPSSIPYTQLSLTSLVGLFPIFLQNFSHVLALASWNQNVDSHTATQPRWSRSVMTTVNQTLVNWSWNPPSKHNSFWVLTQTGKWLRNVVMTCLSLFMTVGEHLKQCKKAQTCGI